jgi:hypothetical protein
MDIDRLKHFARERRGLVASWMACWSLCLAAGFAFNDPNSTLDSVAIFVGGLATSGWLYTNYRSRKNQIEKNTYDLISVYTKDSFYVGHRAIVWKQFAPYTEISADHIGELVDKYYKQEFYRNSENPGFSLVQIINFYEYLAIGIQSNILSERLCEDYWKTTFRNFHRNKASSFVDLIRSRDNKTRTDGTKTSTFSNYCWLARRWGAI